MWQFLDSSLAQSGSRVRWGGEGVAREREARREQEVKRCNGGRGSEGGGSCQLAAGAWQLAAGGWQLAAARWQLAAGGWQLADQVNPGRRRSTQAEPG